MYSYQKTLADSGYQLLGGEDSHMKIISNWLIYISKDLENTRGYGFLEYFVKYEEYNFK